MTGIFLRSFSLPDPRIYRMDRETGGVVALNAEDVDAASLTEGFGEHALTFGDAAPAFVACFRTAQGWRVSIAGQQYAIDDSTRAEVKLPWMGKKRVFSLIRDGRVICQLAYEYRGRDYFEESDGDLCHWISREVSHDQGWSSSA